MAPVGGAASAYNQLMVFRLNLMVFRCLFWTAGDLGNGPKSS